MSVVWKRLAFALALSCAIVNFAALVVSLATGHYTAAGLPLLWLAMSRPLYRVMVHGL